MPFTLLQKTQYFWVLFLVEVFLSFFLFYSTRTLIKIHQKKYFQQQCLKMLPPPVSSIKSGSSNLKGDEKLSLTLCHTPVKRQAHSKQKRVQVLIYYFTQIIFLPFVLTMGTFTSQMELSLVLWAFADLKFCFPSWKRQGKKRIGSLPTKAALMFISNNGRHVGIISMGMNVQIIFQLYQVKEEKPVRIHVCIYTLQKYNSHINDCKTAKHLISEMKMLFKGNTRSLPCIISDLESNPTMFLIGLISIITIKMTSVQKLTNHVHSIRFLCFYAYFMHP